jgi:hypothetical protein
MTDEGCTRRRLLRAGGSLATLGATGLLAGCQTLFGGSRPTGETTALQHVPETALLTVDVDLAALRSDEDLRAALDANLDLARRVSDRVPATTAAALDRVESAVGLDPRGVERVVGFGAREPDPAATTDRIDPFLGGYWGTVAWTDWVRADVRSALEADWGAVEQRRFRGYPVLAVHDGWVAFLGDGRLAMGPQNGVEAALQVADGGEAAETGQLRTALASARSGPVRFGLAPDAATDRDGGFTDPVALLSGKIDYLYGGLYRDGDRRGLAVTFETGSGADAEDVHESLDSFLALARAGQFGDDYRAVLQPLETTRDGSRVRASYEAETEAFATTLLSVATAVALPR